MGPSGRAVLQNPVSPDRVSFKDVARKAVLDIKYVHLSRYEQSERDFSDKEHGH